MVDSGPDLSEHVAVPNHPNAVDVLKCRKAFHLPIPPAALTAA